MPRNLVRMHTYFWVISFMRPYKWSVFLLVLSGLAAVISQMSIPTIIQVLVDDVFLKKNTELFRIIIIAFLFVLLILFAASIAQNLLRLSIQEKASRDLQYAMFQQLRKLGFSYYEQHAVGDTLSMFNTDVAAVQRVYSEYFPGLIQQILFVTVPFVFLVNMDWQLTLFILPCYFLYYLSGPYIDKKTTELLEKQTIDSARP